MLLLQAVSLHKCASSASQWNHHKHISENSWWLTVDSTVVLCISQTLQFCCSSALLAIYPLLVLEIVRLTILYSCKGLKTFNHHLNQKHKFTKVTENALCIHFWYTIPQLDSLLYYVLLVLAIYCSHLSNIMKLPEAKFRWWQIRN